jgi:hypothetical protein
MSTGFFSSMQVSRTCMYRQYGPRLGGKRAVPAEGVVIDPDAG